MKHWRSFTSRLGVLSLFAALGRGFGFARELLILYFLGVSAQADSLLAVLVIPDLIVALVAAGVFEGVFIPEFRNANSIAALRKLGQRALRGALLGGALITLIVFPLRAPVLQFLFPSLSESHGAAIALGLVPALLSIPANLGAGVLSAWLYAKDRIVSAALLPSLFNGPAVVSLGVGLAIGGEPALVGGSSILIGALARFGAAFVLFLKASTGASQGGSSPSFSPGLTRRYGEVLANGLSQSLFPVVIRSWSALAGPGALALTSYVLKWVELPILLFAQQASTLLLNRLSGSKERLARFAELSTLRLWIGVGLAVYGVATALIVRGLSVPELSVLSAPVLLGASLACVGKGVSLLDIAWHQASRATRTPFLIGATQLAVVAGGLLLVRLGTPGASLETVWMVYGLTAGGAAVSLMVSSKALFSSRLLTEDQTP